MLASFLYVMFGRVMALVLLCFRSSDMRSKRLRSSPSSAKGSQCVSAPGMTASFSLDVLGEFERAYPARRWQTSGSDLMAAP